MGKFSNNNLSTIKIPLEQIREESGNVRKVYDWEEIENLAKSIQVNGLLNPLTVKPGVMDEYGSGKNVYELICGHRRLRALALLHKQGVDVGLVECCIRTGDTWTLQMIENIQRTDLTAQDKESAIKEMLEKGLSQKQIADLLSKPISYVSDIVAGTKVREVAESAGVDTSALKTRALAQLRSIEAGQLPQKVQELAQNGGTNAAATEILHEYKAEQASVEDESDLAYEKMSQEALDEFEIGEAKPATTHVSSKNTGVHCLESGFMPNGEFHFSVYGILDFSGKHHELDLDGVYTEETALKNRNELKRLFPDVSWFVYDRNTNATVEYKD